jgi:hypothetical protein
MGAWVLFMAMMGAGGEPEETPFVYLTPGRHPSQPVASRSAEILQGERLP